MSERHSSGPTPRSKPAKPAKPYADFPLFPHASGRWCKKIRGKQVYFGPWADPDAALAKYLATKDTLHAGLTPRDTSAALTVFTLCGRFLTMKKSRLDTGELRQRTYDEYANTCKLLIKALGKNRLVVDLRPDDFARLRDSLAKKWGPVRLGNAIQYIRSVFKFGADAALMDRPIQFGPGFARPSKRTLRVERAKKGLRMFEAADLRRLLGCPPWRPLTTVPFHAMILLGINCGYGNADCALLPLTAVNLDGGWIQFYRPKTGISRRCRLWPETIAALRQALDARPMPRDDAESHLFFVTKFGAGWDKSGREGNHANPISWEMKKLLKKLDLHRAGLGFYALRHTFETIGGEARDQVAVDAIMGHARDDMASVYRERISDERLEAATNHVRRWLFGHELPHKNAPAAMTLSK